MYLKFYSDEPYLILGKVIMPCNCESTEFHVPCRGCQHWNYLIYSPVGTATFGELLFCFNLLHYYHIGVIKGKT